MGDVWRGGVEVSSIYLLFFGFVESVDVFGGIGNVYGG